VKFIVGNLNKKLLSLCESRENQHSEDRISLMEVNGRTIRYTVRRC